MLVSQLVMEKKLYIPGLRRDKVTLSLKLKPPENIHFVLVMNIPLMLQK
jgi:hypothetical protein